MTSAEIERQTVAAKLTHELLHAYDYVHAVNTNYHENRIDVDLTADNENQAVVRATHVSAEITQLLHLDSQQNNHRWTIKPTNDHYQFQWQGNPGIVMFNEPSSATNHPAIPERPKRPLDYIPGPMELVSENVKDRVNDAYQHLINGPRQRYTFNYWSHRQPCHISFTRTKRGVIAHHKGSDWDDRHSDAYDWPVNSYDTLQDIILKLRLELDY